MSRTGDVDPALLRQYGHESKIPEELLAATPPSTVDFHAATTPLSMPDPEEEKQKTLALIRNSYQRGLELYHSGDSDNLVLQRP